MADVIFALMVLLAYHVFFLTLEYLLIPLYVMIRHEGEWVDEQAQEDMAWSASFQNQ